MYIVYFACTAKYTCRVNPCRIGDGRVCGVRMACLVFSALGTPLHYCL